MFFPNKTNRDNKIETLFIVDILYMKDINALYGFHNGNLIISNVLQILKTSIHNKIQNILNKLSLHNCSIDIINPYIDIFMIRINTNIHHIYIKKIADMILNEITSKEFKFQDIDLGIYIDLTIGCSKWGSEDIVVYAEKALQIAKTNHIHFSYFDPKFFTQGISRNDFIELIKSNISQNSITPYFQSIHDNTDDSVDKYEALMRIKDLDGNILNPGAFLTKSKKYRLYPKLMSIMLEKVLNIIKEHKIHVSINFECTDILNPMLKSLLISQMQAYGIGKFITIEILESEKIQDFQVVRSFIQEIKQYGAKVAIDDFGTGFSNYEHVLELNVDYLKLDGSLVEKVDHDIYYNLIKSIVSFCKNEDIKVTAEFVKDISISRYVKSLDIDYSQGYYLSMPKSIEEIKKEIYDQ